MLEWFRKLWQGEPAQGEFTPFVQATKDVEPEEKPQIPIVAEGIKCLVETILRDPKRFRFHVSPASGHSAAWGYIEDRRLGRKWEFTYFRPYYDKRPEALDVVDLVVTRDEAAYLIARIRPMFDWRSQRLQKLKSIRYQRKLHAARDELHKLYCGGDTCVASCN